MASSADSPSWSQHFLAAEREEASELYQILAARRRRVLLSVLDQADGPVSVSELARAVASHESGHAPEAVTSDAGEKVRISLHHTHLPLLEAHDLIERTDGGSIRRTQHPFWTDSDLRTFVTQPDLPPATTTATLDSLTNRQCRAILACLHEHRTRTVGELAEELAGSPISGRKVSTVRTELTHRHLPKLEAADLIEVDATGNRVRYTGNAVLERWFAEVRDREVEQS
ncbi:winged helix-turn-helix domain-containing protein [Haloglomus litoreum]|uniref:winged helix-turn-helix domain-containing protein n=1 Tax=Haloglomus litoreum TaxID=3034026 RepID=UPI0023E8412D|nr:winged helix-turn-helix domain-containing protein [Haloglomus sp. DT116]